MTDRLYVHLASLGQMAAELDHCQQLLMDDRRQRHPLADRARLLLDEADGPAVPNDREPASVALQPSDAELDELAWTWYSKTGSTWYQIEAFRAYARAALARWGGPTPQPVAEGPTDEELETFLVDVACQNGDMYYADPKVLARAVLDRWGRPTPQPEEADIHYAWELHDAAGDWQAGGSANSLEDVQREGNRYLQTYSQDGPHKLIIQRHCVSTIEETTND